MGAMEELSGLLKFNPNAKTPNKDVFVAALEEVTKKRNESLKGQAVGLLEKAIELSNKRDDLGKQFRAADKKFEKELGKVLKSIKAMAEGKEPEPEKEDGEKDDQAS